VGLGIDFFNLCLFPRESLHAHPLNLLHAQLPSKSKTTKKNTIPNSLNPHRNPASRLKSQQFLSTCKYRFELEYTFSITAVTTSGPRQITLLPCERGRSCCVLTTILFALSFFRTSLRIFFLVSLPHLLPSPSPRRRVSVMVYAKSSLSLSLSLSREERDEALMTRNRNNVTRIYYERAAVRTYMYISRLLP